MDSGHARKVPQLKKQGALRSPWGRWAGWWAGLWRCLRRVKLPLLIEQARDDGINFFIRRGRPFPASLVAPCVGSTTPLNPLLGCARTLREFISKILQNSKQASI